MTWRRTSRSSSSRQCKQTEWFSVMAKGSNYFLSLDDKSKQRYKINIYNVIWTLSDRKGRNFHQFSDITYYSNCFLFSLSPLTKKELKAYESLQSYILLASGWVKEVKIKLFLNYLLKLSWLLDRSARNLFPSPFYCSILIRCIVFIALAKILERKGSILPASFYGQLTDY